MAVIYVPCDENQLGCQDPDETVDWFVSIERRAGSSLIVTSIVWLLDGPLSLHPSTPITPQDVTVADDFTGESFEHCEWLRLYHTGTAEEKSAALNTKQTVTLRLGVSDGRSFDRSFTLDVVAK